MIKEVRKPRNSLPIPENGEAFGSLTVMGELRKGKFGNREIQCRCVCGTIDYHKVNELISGHVKSCGCLRYYTAKSLVRVHGMTNHPLYKVYKMMMQRCYNPNHKSYISYGGRGIMVCDAWRNDNSTFFDWALNNGWEFGLEIDRKENDGSYSPENCRFVTSKSNTSNRRNSVYISYNGEQRYFYDLCIEKGVKYCVGLKRLKIGLPIELIFSLKKLPKTKK